MIFYKSDTSLQLKWGKLPAKAEQNRGLTAPVKPLVAIGELQCDCVSTKNDRSNKKIILTPVIDTIWKDLFMTTTLGKTSLV